MKFSSDTRGFLKDSVDASYGSLEIEGGRHFKRSENTQLTAQTWLRHSKVSMDSFADIVGAEVSLGKNSSSTVIGIGGSFETKRALDGAFSFNGTLGFEKILKDNETEVLVSGENLKSKAPSGVSMGLGATYHGRKHNVVGVLQSRGLGSKGKNHSIHIAVQIPFS